MRKDGRSDDRSFSYDEPLAEDTRKFIEEYFEERGIKVQFNGNNMSFVLL